MTLSLQLPMWMHNSARSMKESLKASLWSFYTQEFIGVTVAGHAGRIETSVLLSGDKVTVFSPVH